jgi:predicted NAD/FAD-dependent oxidoreductase
MGALIKDWFAYLENPKGFKSHLAKGFTVSDLKKHLDRGDHVFLCVPPAEAALLLAATHPELSKLLDSVEMLPVLSATLIFPKDGGERGMPQGFGVLFARDQGFDVLGVLRNHCIFEGRSSAVSETWIYSGNTLKERKIWKDEMACSEMILKERAKLSGERIEPLTSHLQFWDEALPHYTLDLEKILESEELKQMRKERLQLFGNYTGQIGLSRLFLEAKRLAENL